MKTSVTLCLVLLSFCLHAQTPIDESAIPSTGISYQNGPGGGNAQNWTYPYGAKLSVFGSTYRNFEIMNTQKTGNSTLAVRTYDPAIPGWTSWRELVFKSSNGFLGIGTTTPSTILDVANTGDGAELLRLSTERPWVFRQSNTGAFSELDLHSVVGDKNFKITSPDNTRAAQFFVSNTVGNSRVFLVPDGGKVGIGSTALGSHTLAVEGSIGAREIKVEVGSWSDFVFDNDYELRSLEEVAQHIAEKGHLPEIPSEKEVLAEGINLGEMNAKLLQKIEELTLYLIEQNKENGDLRKSVEMLQKEVNSLKRKID